MYKNPPTFRSILVSEGVVLVSNLNIDYPFILSINPQKGFLAIHGDYADYRLRADLEKYPNLTFAGMEVYHGENSLGQTKWIVAIPFLGCEIDVAKLLPGWQLGSHKRYNEDHLPANYTESLDVALIVGIPE